MFTDNWTSTTSVVPLWFKSHAFCAHTEVGNKKTLGIRTLTNVLYIENDLLKRAF
jgi:hypothetical protein